ncbi:MAG: hypothetical protein AAF696_15230 [Bacteroidota bacterium]
MFRYSYFFIRFTTPFLCVLLLAAGKLDAQNDLAQLHTDISPNYQYLNLNEGWKEPSGEDYSIPFQFEGLDARTLVYELKICVGPQDSMYLYFEGVAWHAELEIDDIYLGTHENPFEPWIVPLARSWIDNKKVRIKLHLTESHNFPNYPKPFLGIYRPAYLVNKTYIDRIRTTLLPQVQKADTVAIIAPYYRSSGYVFDAFEAAQNLLPVAKNKIKYLYFPFEPGREFRAFAKEKGFYEQKSYDPNTTYALINTYPFDRSLFEFPNRFWLDEQANRNTDYLVFFQGERSFFEKWAPVSEKTLLLIFLILFPIISLYLIKLANPGFFYGMQGMLINPKLYVSASAEASIFSNQGLLYILHLLSIGNLAIWISLGVYYMQSINYWEFLHIFREQSLLSLIFDEEDSLFLILSKSFLLLLTWFVLKQVLLGILGGIFNVKGMRLEILGLEIVADYPLILFLSTPFALFLFMDSFWGLSLFFLLLIILLIFYLRALYVMYVGLGRLFSFSYTVKILYICTLNVIPYFILL